MRHHVAGLLDGLEQLQLLEALDDHLAGDEAVDADELGRDRAGHLAEGVEDVDRVQPVTLADLEVVEVVGRGDLHRARALGRVGVLIGDDGDRAADDGQFHRLADQALVARVVGMNGHGGVAQHRFRPGGGDDDVVAGFERRRLAVLVELGRVLIGDAVLQRIGEVPVGAVDLLLLDLKVGDSGLEVRVPVHQPLVAVDQPVAMELDEHLADGGRQALVEGEALTRPVAAGAQAPQLVLDRAAALGLPFPDLVDEGLTAHLAATDVAGLGQLALDDHLGGDAGVVGAGQPQGRLAAHALEADQHVLQRVVQRMADVQAAGDVGRRNDNAERLGVRIVGRGEGAGLFPGRVQARLDGLGIEGLFKHRMSLMKTAAPRERAAGLYQR